LPTTKVRMSKNDVNVYKQETSLVQAKCNASLYIDDLTIRLLTLNRYYGA